MNTILKKLGVNVSAAASPLSSLISSIGQGTNKSVNNSVVNINLNVLKDVNIDEMIDDDDDEERKFLIKELEKKANSKKGSGSAGGHVLQPINGLELHAADTIVPPQLIGGIKRSRSNSSTNLNTLSSRVPAATVQNPLSPGSSASQQLLLSQLNITLNCHYCWAQFQLNVSKNLKNSMQQKENGKYMQHLALHLNAAYKCNECSYPITDTKTFYKHKQFYKHDEKTCIMVDNDIVLPAGSAGSAVALPGRRKTLIATRLKQHHQQLLQLKQQELESGLNASEPSQTSLIPTDSNEIQLAHERDSFKCSLCYGDEDYAPSTSVSCLNRSPTLSTAGASNFSFDKEQVLKHVLIVHLSFLAYKCDTCVQFYAFDEPQTKQHAALVHQCGTANEPAAAATTTTSTATSGQTCHFKLIKTEEEINLAINKAQQFIGKIPAQAVKSDSVQLKPKAALSVPVTPNAATAANIVIEAQPKYKCCRCIATPASTTNPIVLYSYQDALDHVMSVHMNGAASRKDKKLNYELELFEQNLEDLLASETGQTTTITVGGMNQLECDELDEEEDDEPLELDDDLAEWNVILSEPLNVSTHAATFANTTNQPQQLQTSGLPGASRKKRFKTNNNVAISMQKSTSSSSLSDTENNSGVLVYKPSRHGLTNHGSPPPLKRFLFKPHLVYKCLVCSRRMNSFDYTHWLQHELENHAKLYQLPNQQLACFKCKTKPLSNFTQFLAHYKQEHLVSSSAAVVEETNEAGGQEGSLINCLVCGQELKCSYMDMLKHFQCEHELSLFELKLGQTELELIHVLQSHNLCQLSESVRVRRRCSIRVPPALVNPAALSTGATLTKLDLIDKELKLLADIYREQILDKQIVSWLNSEQFLRRNFNYNSHVCIICNATKSRILEAHYQANNPAIPDPQSAEVEIVAATGTPTHRHQFYSDEMKTVVLTNHVLSHFNEYCYRCMSCKISWPDRTQLLKHAQECSNSQVVRTKTKYKLKANCRLQLKFYLQSYMDYWSYEKALENKCVEQLDTLKSAPNLGCKIFLNDIILNKNLLLDVASRFNLNAIHLVDGKQIRLKDEEEEDEFQHLEAGKESQETLAPVETEEKTDISMKDETQA